MGTELNSRYLTLPAVAMRGIVLFPSMVLHFDVGREKSILAIKQAMEQDMRIFLVTQKDFTVEDPKKEDLYKVGVVAKVSQLLNGGKNSFRVMVEGLFKANLVELTEDGPYLTATVRPISEPRRHNLPEDVEEALCRAVLSTFDRYCDMVPQMPKEIISSVYSQKTAQGLFDKIVQNLYLQAEDKQALLEERHLADRLRLLIEILDHEAMVLSWERDIYDQVKEQMDKNQRDYFLREQMRVISNELGEGESPADESMEFVEEIKALKHMPEETKEKLLKECDRLSRTPIQSQEGQIIRTYLETCLDLPWDKATKEHADVKAAARILNTDHYGMKKVKERILEMIAVRKTAPDIKGQILCLVGPPGVGKTSIAKSIATALNRNYVRISLGGVRDEAEIRGHRKTYLGSMPGRIINAMISAKSRNPLMLLDEIDKMGADYKGDPSAAMLEVLDGEQNNTFRDHYLEIPFDLSEVLFITTANDASMIPRPLLDRMEIIEMGSYTREEKFHIASRHLIPKQLKRHGVTSSQIKFQKTGIYALIDGYTREAGVRTLEREIASVCRKGVKKLVSGEAEVVVVNKKTLESYLGAPRYFDQQMKRVDEVGVATGLAWTAVGGETMELEAMILPGSGKIQTTGQLGEVMTESASLAVSYVRSIASDYGIDPDFYKNRDIHIHAPEGAVPKDGPSAGVTITTALVSALSNIPVRHDVAMTGEITLHGKVLPIGGLREKSMAAYRLGIKTILVPEDNKKDLEDVDPAVKSAVTFIFVSHVSEVLKHALAHPPKKGEKPFPKMDSEPPLTENGKTSVVAVV